MRASPGDYPVTPTDPDQSTGSRMKPARRIRAAYSVTFPKGGRRDQPLARPFCVYASRGRCKSFADLQAIFATSVLPSSNEPAAFVRSSGLTNFPRHQSAPRGHLWRRRKRQLRQRTKVLSLATQQASLPQACPIKGGFTFGSLDRHPAHLIRDGRRAYATGSRLNDKISDGIVAAIRDRQRGKLRQRGLYRDA